MNRRCIYEDCSWTWRVFGEDHQSQDTLEALWRKAIDAHLRLAHPDNKHEYIVGMTAKQMRLHVAMADWFALECDKVGDEELARDARAVRDTYRTFIEEKALP